MPKKFIKPISLVLCFCFFFTQTGLAQLLPTQQGLSPQGTVPVVFQLPTLRYLSVNTANPSNYFNFLMDRAQGLSPKGTVPDLDSEATKLIHYFFLGLTLPSESFWVNLKPQEPERITSEELSKTDLGRILLEQDLKLKKDVANYLHPKHPQGKLYRERLYAAIGKDKAKKATITSSNRVWIVPAEAVVLETEDGALVAKAQLKVLLESEYFQMKKKGFFEGWRGRGASPKSSITRDFGETSATGPREEEQIRTISESLMKEIILPALTKEINESPGYAPLRQVYHSPILAEWYKRKHNQKTEDGSQKTEDGKIEKLKNERTNPYASYINSGTTKGLESELPWEKQAIWQEYLKSYQEGEYKLQDTIFGLKRMYFSGGILFDTSNFPIVSSPLTSNSSIKLPDDAALIINTGGKDNIAGNSKVILLPKEIQEAPLPESLPARGQSKETGVSKTEIAGSPVEESASPERGAEATSRSASSAIMPNSKFLKAIVLAAMLVFSDPAAVTDNLILAPGVNSYMVTDINIGYLKSIIQKAGWKVMILSKKDWENNKYLKGYQYHEGGAVTVPFNKVIYYGGFVSSAGHLGHELIHVLQSDVNEEFMVKSYDELERQLKGSQKAINSFRRLKNIYTTTYNPVMTDFINNSEQLNLKEKQLALQSVAANETFALIFGNLVDDGMAGEKKAAKYASCRLDTHMIWDILEGIWENPSAKEILTNYYIKLGLASDKVKTIFSQPLESIRLKSSASSAVGNQITENRVQRTDLTRETSITETGGIDLSQIELTLKDDKYISSLNPADIKILRAAKALKEEWNSLSLLYIHELMLLLKDNLASDIQNKNLLSRVLKQLQSQEFLDPQAIQFFKFIQSQKPISEIRVALIN